MSTGSEAAAATPAPTPAPAAPKMDKKAAAEARATLSAEVADMQRQLLEKTRELSALTATSGKRSSKGKALIDTDPVQGTRDFPPEEMRVRNWLFNEWRQVAFLFGFEEYDAPLLEAESLYTRKAGEEIVDQMYNFTTKGGHGVALRPEMTPSLARLVIAKGPSILLPIKWFSIPQCWRHEAITRGRRREHFQWNMDILGVSGVTAEAELIAAAVKFLSNVGITSDEVTFKVNSRKVLQTLLTNAGVPEDKFASVCVVVDKIEKIERGLVTREEIVQALQDLDLSAEIIDKVITTTLGTTSLEEMKKVVGEDAAVVKEMEDLFALLEAYGCKEWVTFDASVVRGLAYYTGVVFECFDKKGALRAVCGGGRYDNLMKTYGYNKEIPACGFGFGDCVIMELLKELKKPCLEGLKNRQVQDIVIPLNESMRGHAIKVVEKLRLSGRSADIMMKSPKSMVDAYSRADKNGFERVVLVAPTEWAENKVCIKELRRENSKKGDSDRGEIVSVDSLV